MNKTILIGRLTADPELRQTQSGVASCRFTVAVVDRKFADKNTGEKQSDFITCVAWRQTAEFVAKYFSRGKMIVVEGALRNNNYPDKNHADVTHYTLEVLVDNVEFAGDKGSGGNTQQSAPTQQPQEQTTPANSSDAEQAIDGDCPF